MITLTREEAADVLYALEDAAGCVQQNYQPGHLGHGWSKQIETLRARLAQPEPEPVAWLHSFTGYGWQVVPEKLYPTDQPLYTAPITKMRDLVEGQGRDGTWNYDPYFHGMYNGMELMLSILEKREPVFREAPKKWLSEKEQG